MRIFVDSTAWIQLLDSNAPDHELVRDLFQSSLDSGERLFTHNVAVGMAMSEIKNLISGVQANRFYEIIEDAYVGAHLHVLWIGRRSQKEAARLMRKDPESLLDIYDYVSYVLMKRRRIHTILTTNEAFSTLGLKVLPDLGDTHSDKIDS